MWALCSAGGRSQPQRTGDVRGQPVLAVLLTSPPDEVGRLLTPPGRPFTHRLIMPGLWTMVLLPAQQAAPF